jgi:hypothetical protein
MSAVLQLAGALAVLSAFVAVQLGAARPSSLATLAVNLAGSAVLAALALIGRQWGFLLLEGTWAAVSAGGLARHVVRANLTVSGRTELPAEKQS